MVSMSNLNLSAFTDIINYSPSFNLTDSVFDSYMNYFSTIQVYANLIFFYKI